MLQISTGKFFRPVKLYTTRHRSVLFTNYRAHVEIETPAGTLRPLEGGGDVAGLLYEADERLEAIAPDGRQEFLASVGEDYMPQDFAAIASFALAITCTLDVDLAHRLTLTSRLPLGVPRRPCAYVQRVFDAKIEAEPTDPIVFRHFVSDLVGLERKRYEAVLRAIRRYVTGLHRIGDDLDLAYTLLVASIESLAQSFDTRPSQWEDFDPAKRTSVDEALTESDASVETQQRVRAAILGYEDVALSRRYREFVLAYIGPNFYRNEAVGQRSPCRKRDLSDMLGRAYRFRSKYLHRLAPIPRLLTAAPTLGDVASVAGEPVLTFQGLARVARHVIRAFVEQSPKLEHESFDYRSALPNVVRMQIAESFWIHSAQGYHYRSARRYLSGFLNQLASALTGVPNGALTDLTKVMEKIEDEVSGLATPEQRLPMLVLYGLYHAYTAAPSQTLAHKVLLERYDGDFQSLSVESMIAHLLLSPHVPWTPTELARTRDLYYAQRRRRDGMLLPPVFETALTLSLAESHRLLGEDDHARRYIAEAVEDQPGDVRLITLETRAQGGAVPTMSWRDILLVVGERAK